MTTTPRPDPFTTPVQLSQIEPGYSDSEWRLGSLPGAIAAWTLSDDNEYCHFVEMPTPSGNLAIIRRLRQSREIALKFYGLGADDSDFTGKIWGVKNSNILHKADNTNGYEFFGDILGAFTATLGTGLTHADSVMFDQQYRLADTVAFSADYSITPGVLAVGDAANCAIVSILDRAPGYSWFIIEFDLGSATDAGFLYSN